MPARAAGDRPPPVVEPPPVVTGRPSSAETQLDAAGPGEAVAAAAADVQRGSLPFTGGPLALEALFGLALTGGGVLLQRRDPPRSRRATARQRPRRTDSTRRTLDPLSRTAREVIE